MSWFTIICTSVWKFVVEVHPSFSRALAGLANRILTSAGRMSEGSILK